MDILLNLAKKENISLFFLTFIPIAFIAGSFVANLITIFLLILYLSYQNKKDFKNSSIPVLNATELVNLIKSPVANI